MKAIKRNLILLILAILLALLSSAVIVHSQMQNNLVKPNYGPQVVLIAGKSSNGTMIMTPKTQVWFRVGPLSSEEHPAPLPEGTNMICRAYDFHGTNGTYIALKCGSDNYLIQGVGIGPGK